MVKRKKIVVSYQYNENWIGGTYYIQNIIKSLNYLDDAAKPEIQLLYSAGSGIDDIKITGYPYIEYIMLPPQSNLFKRACNKFSYWLNGSIVFPQKVPINTVDYFYPYSPAFSRKNIKSPFVWIPDLQEHFLPHFFSEQEKKGRRQYQLQVIKSNLPIIFSSETSLRDFEKIYPESRNTKSVLRFLSIVDQRYQSLDINAIKEKFAITSPYFIITNQFWKHKNHETAIKAFHQLIQDGHDCQLVLTGKEFDHRNPLYVNDLKQYVAANGLSSKILFLGFINRNEQLKLMSASIAIIQPSLFEGWSTVVEDAKTIEKEIIVSDLPIHREQLQSCSGSLFFDPSSETDLVSKMKAALTGNLTVGGKKNNDERIRQFAQDFVSLFN